MLMLTLILVIFVNTSCDIQCYLKISTEIEGNGYIVAFVSTPTLNETASFNASLLYELNWAKKKCRGNICSITLGIIIFNICSRETTSQAALSSLLDSRFVDNKTGESIIYQYASYLPEQYNKILLQFAFSELIAFYTPHEVFISQYKSIKKDRLHYTIVLNKFIETLNWQNVAILHIYNDDSYLEVNSLWRELKQRYPTLCITYYNIHGNNETHMKDIVNELKVNKQLEVIFGFAKTDPKLIFSPNFIYHSRFVNFLSIASKQGLRNKTWFWNHESGIIELFILSRGYKKNAPRNVSEMIDGIFVYDMSFITFNRKIASYDRANHRLDNKVYSFIKRNYQHALFMTGQFYSNDIKYMRKMNSYRYYTYLSKAFTQNVYFQYNSAKNLYVTQTQIIFTETINHTLANKISHFKWGNIFYRPPKSLCSKPHCAPGFGTANDMISNTQTKKVHTWTCNVCLQNFIKATYGSTVCKPCNNITVSNHARTVCIDPYKSIFLRYNSTPGYVTISISIVGLTYSLIVIITLIRYRYTPVVKSFNLPLSLFQLAAHVLLFIMIPLIYISKPNAIKCLFRNGLAGFLMVIICSVIFVKVQKLVFIFKSKVVITESQRNVATTVDIFIIIILVLVVFALEVVMWKKSDLLSKIIEKKVMIRNIFCTSETNLHVHTTYIIIISVCCAVQGLRARHLPSVLKETMCIIYAMITSITILTIMLPMYYSTAATNEKTAIHAIALSCSNFILLATIYSYKIYIIYFLPQQNKPAVFRKDMAVYISKTTDKAMGKRTKDK